MNMTAKIRNWLIDSKGRLPAIAEASGVNYWTILSFMSERTKTLRSNNFEALAALMEQEDANRLHKANGDRPAA